MVREGWETIGIYLKVCDYKATIMYGTNSMYPLGGHTGYLMTFYQLQMLSSITLC